MEDDMLAEKFTRADVAALRQELLDIPDPFQNAEVLHDFLACRGYGVSSASALEAAGKMGAAGCSFAAIQAQLEAVALVM